MLMGKLFKKVLSTTIVLAMIAVMFSGTTAMAAEIYEETQTALEESLDIKYQEPVEISDIVTANGVQQFKIDDKIDINKEDINKDEINSGPTIMPQSTVVAGSVSGYLRETGDAAIYNISLPAGVYLQAQLTTPANASLDYDLYLLDSEGYILTGSDYYTQINGTNGTLPEALGYITSGGTATYYLYVHSSAGGSVTEAFTLEYSISTACDSFEIDESARYALPFTFGIDGAYIASRNLSSPIDNDWYVITIPASRIYNKLNITATTESANTCSVEVYQNIASSGYKMRRVGNGSNISVSTGTYYVRVSNAKSMADFDDLDIQNYQLTIIPVLTATDVVITDLNGTEGLNRVVTYPGYGTYFRTKGSGTLTIYGVAVAKDPITNTMYAAVGAKINGLYYSPAWDNNNTPSNARRTGVGYTDSQGKFEINISLPPAVGVYWYDVGTSDHYFDICGVSATLDENRSISDSLNIFHLAYTMYHPF